MENLLHSLRARYPSGTTPQGAGGRFLPDSLCAAGLETRTHATGAYLWDGRKRSGDPDQPFVVFQVTLQGEGRYDDAAGTHTVGVGKAFAALVPGPHRYYLPAASPSWTFFWVLVRHPYVVGRISERVRTAGSALLNVHESSLVILRAVALLEGRFGDRFAEEEALLEFMVAFDRHLASVADDQAIDPEREKLLDDARRFVLERLERPVEVAEFAATQGKNRSRFSHHFRRVTGDSPAHYLARVRLEEVARALVQTDDTLRAIAEQTGFADANHLCKAFRRHFRLSPGAFRRQMR